MLLSVTEKDDLFCNATNNYTCPHNLIDTQNQKTEYAFPQIFKILHTNLATQLINHGELGILGIH